MEQNKLLRANYLDILFDGRNKAYGGYELRNKYSDRARKACATVVLGVLIAAAVPVIATSLAGTKQLEPPIVSIPILTTPLDMPDKPKDIPIPVIEPPAPMETIRNTIPLIEPDDKVTEAPPSVEETHDKQPGIATTTGDPRSLEPGIIPSGGSGSAIVETGIPHEEKPPRIVEQMPQFNGDIEKYLRDNLRYPESAREANIEGRVGIQFIVNEDGSISEPEVFHKAASMLDAEAMRVVRSMPKWKPGKQGGKAVKVYFTLPISFKLD